MAIGAVAFFIALIVQLPARFVVTLGPRWIVSGTVWNGEAVLDGAYRMAWRWAPWRSLASLAFAADVRFDGSGTDIAGSATKVSGGVLLEGLSGRGDGALLNTLAPRLPFTCDTPVQVDLPRLMVAGTRSAAIGSLRFEPGSCAARGSPTSAALPALLATATKTADGTTALSVTPAGQGRLQLMRGDIIAGRLQAAPTPQGLRTMPFLAGLSLNEEL